MQHHFPSTWGSAQPHKAEKAAEEAPSATPLEKQPPNQGSGCAGVVTCCVRMSRALGANAMSAEPQRDFAPFIPSVPTATVCLPLGAGAQHGLHPLLFLPSPPAALVLHCVCWLEAPRRGRERVCSCGAAPAGRDGAEQSHWGLDGGTEGGRGVCAARGPAVYAGPLGSDGHGPG